MKTAIFAVHLVLAPVAVVCEPVHISQHSTAQFVSLATAGSPGDQVHTTADLNRKNGNLVEVFGIYQQAVVGKDADMKLAGHAAVRLDDGTLIYLQPPWHPWALRPPEEIAGLDGRAVVAKGIVFAECPPPPQRLAHMKVPCIYPEVIVLERRVYDSLRSGRLE